MSTSNLTSDKAKPELTMLFEWVSNQLGSPCFQQTRKVQVYS